MCILNLGLMDRIIIFFLQILWIAHIQISGPEWNKSEVVVLYNICVLKLKKKNMERRHEGKYGWMKIKWKGTCYKKETYYFDSLGEFWNCL